MQFDRPFIALHSAQRILHSETRKRGICKVGLFGFGRLFSPRQKGERMNQLVWLVLLLLVALQSTAVHCLVWSLVLGNPVVDLDEETSASSASSASSSQESDMEHPRNTKRITSSRPTRHHHGQVLIHTFIYVNTLCNM